MHFVDNLNPVLMHLGPLQVRWYGVMYALSFIIGYYLICYVAQKRGDAMAVASFSNRIESFLPPVR